MAVDYRFSPEFLAYASVATGYKGGGVNPRPFFGPSAGECSALPPGVIAPCNQVQSFRPETIRTYEVGFKSDFADRKVRLNAAAFYNEYSDIILTLTACPASPCLLPANVGKAHVKGIEVETTIRPVTGLTIDGSLSYIDFKYTSITGATGVALTAVTPFTPKWTYSFGVQYDTEVAGGTLSGRFDGSYQSHVFFDADNDPFSRVPGRFLGNASLRYTTADKGWQVGLEVQNVFDKYYMVSVQNLTKPGSLGVQTGMPGLPRTWAVTVKKFF